MGCCPSELNRASVRPVKPSKSHRRPMAAGDKRDQRQGDCSDELTEDDQLEMHDMCFINDIFRDPPIMKSMTDTVNTNHVFMIEPFEYDASDPNIELKSVNYGDQYVDRWDENHLCMPCSSKYTSKEGQPLWPTICEWINFLKGKCNKHEATFEDLQKTIDTCSGVQRDLGCLKILINQSYSEQERTRFMYTILSKICDLVLNLDKCFIHPPPLLRTNVTSSVTMSQQQAASLLACSFFCLFPNRIQSKGFANYQNPNFDTLYSQGPERKDEKIKCILHYFDRITEKMPTGVITFQRYVLQKNKYPHWKNVNEELCELQITTNKRIEDIPNTLQVDFANEYIGGGVLGNGCVQEEIRFSICPEMLVSLLLCEKMEKNECIFLIGCERFSSYKGYANTFKFRNDYRDETPKDNWGRKWCHLVAMDAIYFRDPSSQYQMNNVDRELLKAYTSFRSQGKGPEYKFGIATGNWGCGAFNGDRQLKAIIQLMAASYARRPLIYAAFGDKNLGQSLNDIYKQLKEHRTKVADLYNYLQEYGGRHKQSSLFDFIRAKLKASKTKF